MIIVLKNACLKKPLCFEETKKTIDYGAVSIEQQLKCYRLTMSSIQNESALIYTADT